MSNNAKITYLKSLLDDFAKETNQLISYHSNDLNEIANIVQDLSDGKSSLNNNIYFKVAGMINDRISFLRELNIGRLKSNDEEEHLVTALKNNLHVKSFEVFQDQENQNYNNFKTSYNKSKAITYENNGSIGESLSINANAIKKHSINACQIVSKADVLHKDLSISENVESKNNSSPQSNNENEFTNKETTKINLYAETTANKSFIINNFHDTFDEKNEGRQKNQSLLDSTPLEIGSIISVQLSQVVSPAEFYVFVLNEENQKSAISSGDSRKQDEVIFNKNLNFKTKVEAKQCIQSNCCMVLDKSNNTWYKAKVVDWLLENNNDILEVYKYATATKIKVNLMEIRSVELRSDQQPSLKCYLYNLQSVGQTWSQESTNHLKTFLQYNCKIAEKINDTYGVILYFHDFIVNNFILEKGWAIEKTDLSQSEEKYQLKDLENIDMAKIENESTNNACLAVMGYIPSDEGTICKFYNRLTGDCFKGGHCVKKHEIINPDGWTNDRKPTGFFNLPPMLIPSPGTFVNVKVTHVNYPTVFHGLYYYNTNIQIGQFDNIADFANYMNDPNVVSSYKRLTRDPVVGELVIAPYAKDDYYYRAKILQPVENGYIQVLFIDYGNAEEVSVNDLRQFLPEFADIPAQAISFSLANVSLQILNTYDEVDFLMELIEKMSSLLLYKVLNCKIVSCQGKELEVIAYLDGLDISFHLERLGFIKRLEPPATLTEPEHQVKSPFIIPG